MSDATAKDLEQDRAISKIRDETNRLSGDNASAAKAVTGLTDLIEDLQKRVAALEKTAQTLQPIEHAIDRIRSLK